MVKQLGKYEIIRTLGQGAMGEVYLANHPTIGREVAIKTILPSAARGEDAEGRFRREATAAGKLNHPNLVTIYDFDRDGDILYLVMEYVKGDDLEDLIQERSLSQSQFLELLAQICDGLSFAHRNGIIHRDIKPANVRVMRDGKRLLAKVMDFGIARVEDSGMTATGIVMGTVSYMAPEYIQSGHAAAQCDLWAVGVMLYECLAGHKPFYAENTTTILFKIVTEAPMPLEADVIQGVSPSIRNVLERALAKDPTQRFQTADEFARALRACKDPSWIGSIEEAMAHTSSIKSGIPVESSVEGAIAGDGTVQLKASATTTTVPPAGSPAAPTQMAPTPSGAAEPTALMPSARVAESVPVKSGDKGKSGGKGLVLAAAAAGLAVVAGGAFFVLRKKTSDNPALTSALTSASTSALPAQTGAAPLGNGVTPAAGTAVGPAAGSVAEANGTPSAHPAQAVAPATTPATQVSSPKIEATRPGPAHTETPKPVEETPAQKLEKAVALIGGNPRQAASQLQTLAVSQPGDVQVQANYLAALYRSRNAGEFDRVFRSVRGRGLSTRALLSVKSFKDAIGEESKLQRAKSPDKVLSMETMSEVLKGL